MQRIKDTRHILLVNMNDNAFAHGDKIPVGNLELPSVRQPEDKWFEIWSQSFPDVLKIQHG